jgi:heme-degrading monooxygenase HmoA
LIARLIWGRVATGRWPEYEKLYREQIVPRTEESRGLKRRQLLQSMADPDEALSLTLWDSRENLQAYEQGEARASLLPELAPVWVDERWPKTFDVRAEVPPEGERWWASPRTNAVAARFALGTVASNHWDEYEAFFRDSIAPTVGQLEGLIARQLFRNVEDRDEGVSISLWDSARAIMAYEESEVLRTLRPGITELWTSPDDWQKAFWVWTWAKR